MDNNTSLIHYKVFESFKNVFDGDFVFVMQGAAYWLVGFGHGFIFLLG